MGEVYQATADEILEYNYFIEEQLVKAAKQIEIHINNNFPLLEVKCLNSLELNAEKNSRKIILNQNYGPTLIDIFMNYKGEKGKIAQVKPKYRVNGFDWVSNNFYTLMAKEKFQKRPLQIEFERLFIYGGNFFEATPNFNLKLNELSNEWDRLIRMLNHRCAIWSEMSKGRTTFNIDGIVYKISPFELMTSSGEFVDSEEYRKARGTVKRHFESRR
ncbi:hypothetical protein [Bacillus toyonensis]|uniref:hypothetical protein n=1 Tax=Bacillus toyonensis TaxID=155322 RepID=UPI00382E02CF